MSLTLRNIGIGKRSKTKTGGFEETLIGYWDERDRRARYDAVSDACWIYQYRDLEQNLRHFGWRHARRRVLAQGALSREWMNRGRGDLRLTRGGACLLDRGEGLPVDAEGVEAHGEEPVPLGFRDHDAERFAVDFDGYGLVAVRLFDK
mgnify:CR=1 FL=1